MPFETVDFEGTGKIDNALPIANLGCTRAMEALRSIIEKIRANDLSAQELAFLKKYFVLQDEDMKSCLVTVLGKLESTLEGLGGKLKLTISYFNRTSTADTPTLFLAKAQFQNQNQCVRYIIHEATHMFAGTKDKPGGDNKGEYGLSQTRTSTVLDNADSYAVFVVSCANIPLL